MPRGSPSDHMKEFISSIPDSKLVGNFGVPGTRIYSDIGYRLDMQGYTTETEEVGVCFNLQVQVDYGNPKPSVQMLVPGSVAWLLLPINETWTPQMIRDGLLESVTGLRVNPPKDKVEKAVETHKVVHKHNPNKSRKR